MRNNNIGIAASSLSLSLALAFAFAGGASAQTPAPMKPGLWQLSSTLKTQSGQLESAMRQAQEQIAKLPPDQRKAVEKMMAERGVAVSAQGTVLKVCITPEAAQRGLVPVQPGDCDQKVLTQTPTTLSVSFICRGEPAASGTGEITFLSPTTNRAKATVDTVVAGKAERVDVSQDGQWLAADCGSIQPLGR
ncbi:MAG: hypothetical protein RLZZ618_2990 [Pseudomonadota bacterium]|jgi:hypothetical protein